MLKQSLSILTAGLVGALAITACGDSGSDGGAGGEGGNASTTSKATSGSSTKSTGATPTTSSSGTTTGDTTTASTTDSATSATTDTTDASSTADASSTSGMMGGADGNPCTAAAQCDGGTCLDEAMTGLAGGLCTEDCTATGMCTDPASTCVGFGQSGFCLRDCDPATAGSCGAPATLDCIELQGGGGVCFPSCGADNECSGGNVCDETTGACEGVEICDNGMDDNMDGETDCGDGQCAADATCAGELMAACQAAVALANNMTVGGDTTAGSSSFAVADCGGFAAGGGLGRVFTYTATATGNVTFTLDSATDQGISTRSACDNDQTHVTACSDAELGGTDEVISLDVTTGQVVTIVVDAFEGGEEGPFNITAAFALPATNDTCATAIPLIGQTMGSWIGANNDYSPGAQGNTCTGFDAPEGDVAYSFTLAAGQTINVTITPNGTADPSIYIVSDCAMEEATCQAGADDGVSGGAETVTFTSAAGGNFFLIVDKFDADIDTFAISAAITGP